MGPTPLLCGPRFIARPSRLHITTYRRSLVQYRTATHIDKAAVLSWRYTHGTGSTNTNDAMRGRGTVPDSRPHDKAPHGHRCHGECGGRLDGICGEVEDPDSDYPLHRICATFLTAKGAGHDALNARAEKHKADQARAVVQCDGLCRGAMVVRNPPTIYQ